MPVVLEFDTQVTGVDQAVSDFDSLKDPIEEVGETAEKTGGSGGIGGLVGKIGGLGASAISLVNPVGLAVNAVGFLGPKLLEAGQAADAENTEIAQLTNTVQNSVAGWDGNTAALDAAVAAGQRKAFADSDLRASLGQLVTDTGSVEEAIRLQGLAMDLAASKGIPLATATNLVGKADDASYAALAKLGIEIDKSATREDALAAIHTKTAGAADIFASSTEGAGIRAQAAMDDALETIGGAVAPGIQAALGGVAEFLSSDTFSGAVEFVSETLGQGLGAVFEFVQSLIQPLIDALSPLFTAIQNIGIGGQGAGSLMDGFKEILSNVSGFIIANVVPVIGQIAQFLADNLPAAIQFAKDAWTNVLQPAIANVWNFVSTVVFPIIGQLVQWLKDNLPPAIQGLANFWTQTLQPALNNVWSFIQTNIIPIFQTVVQWLSVTIPPAIQNMANFWNTVLKPALENVWKFIQDNILPILSVLISEGLDKVKAAVGFLADVWNNNLKPALDAIAKFIADPLMPAIDNLIKDGLNALKTAAEGLASFWNGPLKSAINGVGQAIDKVIQFIKDLIDKLTHVELPDWMNPGSPTPWELGLLGVADAMSQVSRNELPTLAKSMEKLPKPELGLGTTGGNTLGTGGPSLLGNGSAPKGTLTIILQDERTILRADRQSESLDLQARLETRESV